MINLNKCPYNWLDSKIQAQWPLIKFQLVNGLLRVDPKECNRPNVKWIPLDKDWIKVNFDEATRGNPSQLGARCVARNHKGEALARCGQGVGITTNNIVEANAALLAIQMAKRLGVRYLQLESDSKIITQAITKGNAIHWKIDKLIQIIITHLMAFPKFKVSHTLREGNREANMQAKEVVDFRQGDIS
ncbi:uncharacterized protein LOC131050196 [Cryptomeria japonica]|uniref:uncharacterized protein LOC131050196 n=1 Tax=Cryptomeria japonica TaxID=3369 RepID=UPI0027D9F6CB|nr:uncharacterized protein LOC131050196 [Cryptomeria japonica]